MPWLIKKGLEAIPLVKSLRCRIERMYFQGKEGYLPGDTGHAMHRVHQEMFPQPLSLHGSVDRELAQERHGNGVAWQLPLEFQWRVGEGHGGTGKRVVPQHRTFAGTHGNESASVVLSGVLPRKCLEVVVQLRHATAKLLPRVVRGERLDAPGHAGTRFR